MNEWTNEWAKQTCNEGAVVWTWENRYSMLLTKQLMTESRTISLYFWCLVPGLVHRWCSADIPHWILSQPMIIIFKAVQQWNRRPDTRWAPTSSTGCQLSQVAEGAWARQSPAGILEKHSKSVSVPQRSLPTSKHLDPMLYVEASEPVKAHNIFFTLLLKTPKRWSGPQGRHLEGDHDPSKKEEFPVWDAHSVTIFQGHGS